MVLSIKRNGDLDFVRGRLVLHKIRRRRQRSKGKRY